MHGKSNTSNSLAPSGPNLGERRRQHLHGAELQRFQFFLVLKQLAVGINLHLDLAVGVFAGEFLNLSAARPFGVSGATTWLNLMTIGSSLQAAGATVRQAAATTSRDGDSLRMSDFLLWCL